MYIRLANKMEFGISPQRAATGGRHQAALELTSQVLCSEAEKQALQMRLFTLKRDLELFQDE